MNTGLRGGLVSHGFGHPGGRSTPVVYKTRRLGTIEPLYVSKITIKKRLTLSILRYDALAIRLSRETKLARWSPPDGRSSA
jgi:hypothetical protein